MVVGRQVRIEDAAAAADVAPVHPHLGQQDLFHQQLEDRLEHSRGGRKTVSVGQGERIGHVRELKTIAAEILLAVALALHQVPLIGQLSGQIDEMTQMPDLHAVQPDSGEIVAHGFSPTDMQALANASTFRMTSIVRPANRSATASLICWKG